MVLIMKIPVKDATICASLITIFAMYLALDMHLVMNGVYKKNICEGDYVYAALKVWIDIVLIFILFIYMCIKRGE